MTRKQLLTTRGGNNEREPHRVVVDPSLLFNGRRFWRRPFRAHCGGADPERFTAILLFDHPTRYRRTPAKVLDSSSCGNHRFHSFVPLLGLETMIFPPCGRASLMSSPACASSGTIVGAPIKRAIATRCVAVLSDDQGPLRRIVNHFFLNGWIDHTDRDSVSLTCLP